MRAQSKPFIVEVNPPAARSVASQRQSGGTSIWQPLPKRLRKNCRSQPPCLKKPPARSNLPEPYADTNR